MSRNRNHLVPTTITNKNGTTTTVYKKPSATTTTTNRLPTVTLPTSPKTRAALEKETATLLVHFNLGEPAMAIEARVRDRDHAKLLTILPKYSDETLQRLNNIPTELGWTAAQEIGIMLSDAPSEEDVNDWITIQPVTARSVKIDRLEHIINGFAEYPKLEPQDNGHYPARRAQQTRAIGRITEYFRTTGEGYDEDINRNGNVMQVIHDEALRDLLTTHENPEAIADIIIARNITDPDQLTALHDSMNRINPALTDGAL